MGKQTAATLADDTRALIPGGSLMILGATFELIDVIEIAVLIAIPVIIITLLVRSFRRPPTARDVEEPKPGVAPP